MARKDLKASMEEAFQESIEVSKARQFEERYGIEMYSPVLNSPAPTTNPDRPRALNLAYIRDTETLMIKFRDGTWIEYDEQIPPEMWQDLKTTDSTGRYLAASGIDEMDWHILDVGQLPEEVRARFQA